MHYGDISLQQYSDRIFSMSDEQGFNPDVMVAVRRLRQAAEAGDAAAQYRLGVMHGNGDGVPLDPSGAAAWIERAAQQGHVEAQNTLAWLYANGHGVTQDDAAARRWYLAAAQQGLVQAQFVVATMYRFGQYGAERDMAQAVAWYQKAADQGLAPAQFALGRLLMEGKHVAPDDSAALQWLSLAHVNGSKRAEEYIRTLLQRMPSEEVARVRQAMLNPQDQGRAEGRGPGA